MARAMFGTCYLGSGAATVMQICAQVAAPQGSVSPYCRYFAGALCLRLTSNATVCRHSRPGSSRKKLHMLILQPRCCEPGWRRYPMIFGFRRSVSSERRTSGSTQKTLFAFPGISKAIGASEFAIRRQRPELSPPRSSPLRVFPVLASSPSRWPSGRWGGSLHKG